VGRLGFIYTLAYGCHVDLNLAFYNPFKSIL